MEKNSKRDKSSEYEWSNQVYARKKKGKQVAWG